MKVIYEFNPKNGLDDDALDLKIFQRSIPMYIGLLDINEYMRDVRKERIEPTPEQISEHILDIIHEIGITEIE